MMQPTLFDLPRTRPARLTVAEKKAVYRCIRFFLFPGGTAHLDGRELTALYSAMQKIKPVRRSKCS